MEDCHAIGISANSGACGSFDRHCRWHRDIYNLGLWSLEPGGWSLSGPCSSYSSSHSQSEKFAKKNKQPVHDRRNKNEDRRSVPILAAVSHCKKTIFPFVSYRHQLGIFICNNARTVLAFLISPYYQRSCRIGGNGFLRQQRAHRLSYRVHRIASYLTERMLAARFVFRIRPAAEAVRDRPCGVDA